MDYALTQIFSSAIVEQVNAISVLIVTGCALALGLFICLTYMFTHRKEGFSQSFAVSLIILAPIVAIVILLIGNNVARAFSLAGAFALVRFRSAPGDPKDIAYVFFSVVAGLASGMGYIPYAAIFVVILCVVMIILHLINFGRMKIDNLELRITVPETLNYHGAFDDILKKYTTNFKISRVRTVDFGALFEVTYSVNVLSSIDTKAFLDELRTRNGNLKIILGIAESRIRDFHF